MDKKEEKQLEERLRVAYIAAFAKMQHELKDVTKSHENHAYKTNGKASTYANLADVLEAARPVWTKYGFAISQTVRAEYVENRAFVSVTTEIAHVSGHSQVYDTLTLPCAAISAHAIASAVTYARRISLMPILGITGADDDYDGNAATQVSADAGASAIRAQYDAYAFSESEKEALRAARLTMRDVVAMRKRFNSNADFIESLGGK